MVDAARIPTRLAALEDRGVTPRAARALAEALPLYDPTLIEALEGGEVGALDEAQAALLSQLLDAMEGPLVGALIEGEPAGIHRALVGLEGRRSLLRLQARGGHAQRRIRALLEGQRALRAELEPLVALIEEVISLCEGFAEARLTELLTVELIAAYQRFQRGLLEGQLTDAGRALDEVFTYAAEHPAALLGEACLCALSGNLNDARMALGEALDLRGEEAPRLEAAYEALMRAIKAPPPPDKRARSRPLRERLDLPARPQRAEGRVYKRRLDAWGPRRTYRDWALGAVAALTRLPLSTIRAAAYAAYTGRGYRAFPITRPSGKLRLIQTPHGPLAEAQASILEEILYQLPASNAGHGATPGRSLVTHAAAHLPQPVAALGLDLADAFPSVSLQRVYRVFYEGLARLLPVSNVPLPEGQRPTIARHHVAHLLAALTCAPIPGDQRPRRGAIYALPQGSPTSGALLNLACADLDRGIYKLVAQRPELALRYTRYVDDLTLSMGPGALQEVIPGELIEDLERLIRREGFETQPRKRWVWPRGAVAWPEEAQQQQQAAPPQEIQQQRAPFTLQKGGAPLVICGLKIEEGRIAFGPALIHRALELQAGRGEAARAELRGLAAFAKQIYPRTPPFLEAWAEGGARRGWSFERAPYLRHLTGHIDDVEPALRLLCQWLDLPPGPIEAASAALEAGEAYQTWRLPKGGGAYREIESPVEPLKRVQARILRRLLDGAPRSGAAHGFARGRSIVTNARAHLGAAALLNVDLEDAFPSTAAARARHALERALGPRLRGLGPRSSKEAVAAAFERLTALVTYQDRLPQGAPTSGAVFNLCLAPMDRLIEDACRPRGVVYTRYADDLTLSSPEPGAIDGELLALVKRIINGSGYRWSARKVKRMAAPRLEVCGVRLDGRQLRISRARMRRYRGILRRLAIQERLSPADREEAAGILGFAHMIYGETPAPLRKATQALRQRHQLKARPKARLDLYGRGE